MCFPSALRCAWKKLCAWKTRQPRQAKKIRPEITNLARRMFFERFEFLDAWFFYLNETHLRFQLLVLA